MQTVMQTKVSGIIQTQNRRTQGTPQKRVGYMLLVCLQAGLMPRMFAHLFDRIMEANGKKVCPLPAAHVMRWYLSQHCSRQVYAICATGEQAD